MAVEHLLSLLLEERTTVSSIYVTLMYDVSMKLMQNGSSKERTLHCLMMMDQHQNLTYILDALDLDALAGKKLFATSQFSVLCLAPGLQEYEKISPEMQTRQCISSFCPTLLMISRGPAASLCQGCSTFIHVFTNLHKTI